MIIRDALPEEYERIGELTASVYVADGYLSSDSEYIGELQDAESRAKHAELIAAVDEPTGSVLGSVTFCRPGTPFSEIARDGEAEFRMLVVDHAARGRGVGETLVRECMRRARDAGCHRLVLLTTPRMRTAHRLYERLGFRRVPERDWWPRPDFQLMAFEVEP
jgi:ribosomal protein S18 acetylase RimI-like enzyme